MKKRQKMMASRRAAGKFLAARVWHGSGVNAAVLVVDTAGFGNQAAAVAIAGADLVLVPVTPGEADLVEAQRASTV